MAGDHPRRCGENDSFLISSTDVSGSPPQVRGKRILEKKPFELPGITPAGAGKTLHSSAIVCSIGDHPRRCGENLSLRSAAATTAGSPPQVRGKLASALRVRGICGITPAGAGKTQAETASRHGRYGSPPQVRGKPCAKYLQKGKKGITPAGAGKTFIVSVAGHAEEDHPRRCGENHMINSFVRFL